LIACASEDEFVAKFGHLFEHSPWVVSRAWRARPFANSSALHQALMQEVRNATPAEQLGLIRAHPELAARVALTAASAAEQSGAGLKNLTAEEFKTFTALNAAYREKFGFPFVVCVRRHSKASILAAFSQRLANTVIAEHAAALCEIGDITMLRLDDLYVEASA
jgi:OHCU decarboxylase